MPSPRFKDWWRTLRATGDICPIRLGMTRDEIEALFATLDDVSTTSRKNRVPATWQYGELEFHCKHGFDEKLWLIYCEVDDVPRLSIRGLYAGEA